MGGEGGRGTVMRRELAVLAAQKIVPAQHLKVLTVHRKLKIYALTHDSTLLYLFLPSGDFSKLHIVNEEPNRAGVSHSFSLGATSALWLPSKGRMQFQPLNSSGVVTFIQS